MALEAGPIPVITSDWFDTTVQSNGLADYVTAQLGELDDVESDMDGFFDPAADIPDTLDDGGAFDDLDTLDDSLGNISLVVDAWQPDQIQQAYDDTGAQLVNVFSLVPAEAWQDVPPEQQFDGSGPVPDTSNPFSATLTLPDQTPIGSVTAGQLVQFNLHIGPRQGGGGQYAGVPVREYGWKEDAVQFSIDRGATDQFGFMSFTQIFGPDDVGNWKVEFFGVQPDGSLTPGPLISFDVQPSAIPLQPPVQPPQPPVQPPVQPPTPQPVQVEVSLVNTSGARQFPNFAAGDSWTLTVNGPPNAAVVISGFKNNQALSPAQVGITDLQGQFVLNGAMSDAEIGLWQELYTVGGVDWHGALLFSVNPA